MSSTQNIYSRPMQKAEAEAVYNGRGRRDFPPDERKPFSMIESLMDNRCYKCCGFYEKADDSLCAYAFMMTDQETNMLLLDYFAVCEEVRGKGYGSIALELLKADYMNWGGMLFEVEDDDAAETEAEKRLRRRRISFYEKNGVLMTSQRSRAFDVDFRLMVMNLGKTAMDDNIGYLISSMYRKMLPDNLFREHFRLR